MTEREDLVRALKGNMDAVYFCEAWFRVTQVWDDLIDKDRPVSDVDINKAFFTCLVDIPSNPFFARHAGYLVPIINAAIVDFQDANILEKGSDREKMVAYVIRDTATTIVTHCAYIVGGYEWMSKIGTMVRTSLHDEDFEIYKQSIGEKNG